MKISKKSKEWVSSWHSGHPYGTVLEPFHRDVSSLLAAQRKDSVINQLRHGPPDNNPRYSNTYSMYKVDATPPSCCAMVDLYCSVTTATPGGVNGN